MSSPLDLLPPLLQGAALTAKVTVWAAVLSLVASVVAGFGSLSRMRLVRIITRVYVELFRGTSLLVQLFWMYYVLPLFGLHLGPMFVAVLGLGLNLGAHGSEVVRSSIQAVPRGQYEAAIALNMNPMQTIWRVILPQAFVMMLPPLGNLSIELLKGTALMSLITLSDATFQAVKLRTIMPSHEAEIFTLLLLIYFAMALPVVLAVRWLERRSAVGRR